MTYIMTSAGNIPVDRKTKDRRKLFAGTMEALSNGAAVALFPEGTSYTEPRIMQVKDGAAWAALEYTKWRKAKIDIPYTPYHFHITVSFLLLRPRPNPKISMSLQE